MIKQGLRQWFSRLEITSLIDWKNHVLDSSILVLVQFHADWSEKSNKLKKQLSPLDSSKYWNTIEVNIDLNPLLAKALEIKTLPSLYLINKGRTVQKFEGDLSHKKYEQLVNNMKLISGEWTEENLAEHLLNTAYEKLENKNWDEAIENYAETLKLEKILKKYELTCWFGLAKSHFQRGDYDNSEFFIDKIRTKYIVTIGNNSEIQENIQNILKTIGDKRDKSKYKEYHVIIQGINQEIFEDPYNNKIHAKLAITHYDFGFIDEAINKCLQVIKSEGTLTGFGYKALMEIVQDLGPDNQYVKDLQPKLKVLHAKYRK